MNLFKKFLCSAVLASTVLGAAAETFEGVRSDFRDETIYFTMTTRFYDGDPKNNVLSWDKQDVQRANGDPDWRGDFAGLIDKLDYIKALGFTAIWITPVVQNASGEDYHGYHSMDFGSVDLRYESRKEWGCEKDVKFEDLIKAAHDKKLKIILDVVLQHTSNFGEAYLNPLFTRDQRITNQATPAGALKPNERLSNGYFNQTGEAQYAERFKFFKNPQYDKHNYYHHYGTGWNWDLPNRWWGQIAGDCVDLNTENDYVAEYIVKCYGKFIEMGVDGFRIDTTGHIAPLTFNKQFIPEFIRLGEENKDKRLNGCPFYMFGECCQRFQGSVVYRDQPNLSGYFYTWASDPALLAKYDGSQAYWDTQVLKEGHDSPVGPMAVCHEDTKDKPRSNNAWMENGKWHQPDYSQSSGFNVIDFPMHYSFSDARSAFSYHNQDNYYNDATYNVVYVDSHDYCPGPNDGTRFNGGTAQWAENLSLMFTFRGIPCIYYGSEVEFKAGKPIDVGGDNNKTPRKDSGRAYFGEYLEGSVEASDFCEYTAEGNVAKTLNADLAQHIIRLNKIRAAVPALRKGQYTTDGCSANGGIAFKRAYKEESYALVALNGGATFTGVPAGEYKDVVTGQTWSIKADGGTITVDAPKTKGQVRVIVKGWNKGIVGEDGMYIYNSQAKPKGGAVVFPDKPTTSFYGPEDVVGDPEVTFNPAGGAFKTANISVTATANSECASSWYKIGNGSQVNIGGAGKTATFTIGDNMTAGQTITVTWGAKGKDGKDYTGNVTYKKVDPNAVITVYCKASSAPYLYAWEEYNGSLKKFNGDWPGKKMTDTEVVNGTTYFCQSFPDVEESLNIIFNGGSDATKTPNIEGITADVYYAWNGGTEATLINENPGPKKPVINATPGDGTKFTDKLTVTLTSSADAIYYTTDGSNPSASSKKYTSPITITETTTIKAYAKNEVGETTAAFTYTKSDVVEDNNVTLYFDDSQSNWGTVYCYIYGGGLGNDFLGGWNDAPKMTKGANGYFSITFDSKGKTYTDSNVIFSNHSGAQTGDNVKVVNGGIYNASGYTGQSYTGVYDAAVYDEDTVRFYNMQGIEVTNPTPGFYIERRGNKVRKIHIR